VHDSIVGSTFTCRVVDSLTADGHPAVIPQITGMAYRCGTSEFTLDPRPLRGWIRAAMTTIQLPWLGARPEHARSGPCW
jgi:proline racemase